jgi:hypothetical protein
MANGQKLHAPGSRLRFRVGVPLGPRRRELLDVLKGLPARALVPAARPAAAGPAGERLGARRWTRGGIIVADASGPGVCRLRRLQRAARRGKSPHRGALVRLTVAVRLPGLCPASRGPFVIDADVIRRASDQAGAGGLQLGRAGCGQTKQKNRGSQAHGPNV